jgi:hypothetical protein
LTGRSGVAEEQACLEAGFDRFVTKSMEANVLRGILADTQQRVAAARAGVETLLAVVGRKTRCLLVEQRRGGPDVHCR